MQTELKGIHGICFEGPLYPWLLTWKMYTIFEKVKL